MYYIFKPIVPIKVVRALMCMVGASLFMIGLLFPARIGGSGGVVQWLYNVGRSVPMVRSLDISKTYTCALFSSFGPAVYLGMLFGILLCFCALDKPVSVERLRAVFLKEKLSLIFLIVVFIGGTWLIPTPPAVGGWFMLISSSRLMIAIVAPGYFLANAAIWMLFFFKSRLGLEKAASVDAPCGRKILLITRSLAQCHGTIKSFVFAII